MLKVSRQNNLRDQITGMLLYRGGNFMQAIEGSEEAVKTLFEKIKLDPRHDHITVLGDFPISKREFPEWTMGFRNIEDMTAQQLEGFSPFLKELSFTPDYFKDHPIRAYIILQSFKETM